jgi:hypothetical protein
VESRISEISKNTKSLKCYKLVNTDCPNDYLRRVLSSIQYVDKVLAITIKRRVSVNFLQGFMCLCFISDPYVYSSQVEKNFFSCFLVSVGGNHYLPLEV